MNAAPLWPDEAYHQAASLAAARIYIAGLEPAPLAAEWRRVTREVRRQILRTLLDTAYLRDLYGPLTTRTGRHLLVLRHLFSPPISQDQLKLVLPSYPKGAEKNGTKVTKAAALAFVAAFAARRDPGLTAWLDTDAPPTPRQVRKLLHALTPMISSQIFNTVRRNRMSDEQEKAVEALLAAKGWTRAASAPVSNTADLAARHFMRKTRCKSSDIATKEVDIACGVKANLIMAMECKVSNDATNSVKRVSDVMDKTKAWKEQWGGFIQTAALLQGVVAYKDVARLLNSNVLVFWSHDLRPLTDWLDAHA